MASILGFTAQQTGELFIPGALASAFCMPFIGGRLRAGVDARVLILVGIGVLACAGIGIARFDVDASTRSMFMPLLLRGAAMAFLFVPINTAVLTQFQGAAIGEAAGLLNLCRQLGGSIAIAMLSTLMAHYQDVAYVSLQSHVTLLDPAAWQQYAMGSNLWRGKLAHGVGLATPALVATKMFYGKVKLQSFILAYQKTLYLVVMLFALALVPLRQLRVRHLRKGEQLPDAH
jgi:DHA2 family multidrug resistance protein